MLGMWRTEEEVGIYNVILRICSILTILPLSLNAFSTPKIAEYFWGNKINSLADLINYISKINFFLSTILTFIIIIFAGEILRFFGENFTDNSIYASLYILLLGYFLNNYFGSVGAILNMLGKEHIFYIITFFSVIINLFLNYILIPKYGILGASISTSFTLFLWKFLGAIYIKKIFKLSTFYIPQLYNKRKGGIWK